MNLQPILHCLLCLTLVLAQPVHAVCNVNMPLTRPDTRYQLVTGTTPAGSEVQDSVTGLVWKRCLEGYRWTGSACTVAGVSDSTTYTWVAALSQPGVANAATPAPATPWRLPSQAELRSLVDRACNAPAHNGLFPYLAVDALLWSSTPFVTFVTNVTTQATTSDYGWSVNFANGFDSPNLKSTPQRVRLVRSAP